MSDGFDNFLADARQAAHRMRARSSAEPCFEDVVERARGLDPYVVPPATERPEDVLELHSSERGTAAEEAELDEMIAGARAAVGRRVAHRRLDGVPAPPLPNKAPPKRRTWVVAGALAMTAAAAVIGLFAMQSTALIEQDEVDTRGEQAARSTPSERSEGHAQPAPPPPLPARKAPRPEHEVAVEVEDEPVIVEVPPEPPRMSAAERAEKRQTRLADLAEQAQRAWRNGDLGEAGRLFERIVAEGGRSRQAEMAYADLFALARQRGQGQGKLWRAYLRRFPRGRFADDARAGLCRVAAADQRPECWRRYLATFPDGSYRAEAERATKP